MVRACTLASICGHCWGGPAGRQACAPWLMPLLGNPGGTKMKSYRVTEFEMPLEMIEVPTPKPSGTEVLLRVKAAGVCHSDLHIWEGGYDLGHGKRMLLKDRGIPLPLTMGHETAGEVVALGPQAEGVKAGEVRLVYPWIGCGKCPLCLSGDEHLCAAPRSLGVYCDGGYADHIMVPHPRYLLDLRDSIRQPRRPTRARGSPPTARCARSPTCSNASRS